MNNILSEIKKRRTYYHLSKKSSISDTMLEHILQETLRHTPTAFNMQSMRLILLLDQKHDALWDETIRILKEMTPESAFEKTKEKIKSFKNAYGTVLFYNDERVVSSYAEKYPLYRDNFPTWSEQSNGMLQSNVWMVLESYKLGANLQHYNPLIDAFAGQLAGIPESWRLVAQMPFGVPIQQPSEKTFLPIEDMFKVIR